MTAIDAGTPKIRRKDYTAPAPPTRDDLVTADGHPITTTRGWDAARRVFVQHDKRMLPSAVLDKLASEAADPGELDPNEQTAVEVAARVPFGSPVSAGDGDGSSEGQPAPP